MLKDQWIQIVSYIILILIFIFLTPPFWLSLIIIDVYIILRALYEKTFKLKKILKSIAYADIMLLGIYCLYWIVGGVWAVIITHVLVGGLIIKGQWKFIMKAWKDLKYCIDKGIKEPRRRHKEWKESQKSRQR